MPQRMAFLFPGQAHSSSGWHTISTNGSRWRANVFARRMRSSALIWPTCASAVPLKLQLTANAQPAILVHSVIACELLRARGIAPVAVAGHSLGEYSALVASGSMPFADAVRVVHRRGCFMQEAVPVGVGAMAAILGWTAHRWSLPVWKSSTKVWCNRPITIAQGKSSSPGTLGQCAGPWPDAWNRAP